MQIANPIYDIIFKYLMTHKEIAKDILSAILHEKIISVELEATETTVEVKKGLQMIRYDFIATIQNEEGALKTIPIEIQKRKKGFEIPRFRRYLGKNYIGSDEPDNIKITLPIATIYFLGYRLKNVKLPVFKIDRTYTNAATQKKIRKPKKDDFVEQLSHDKYVIQIPRLKKMVAQTEAEKLLDVFSQTKYATADNHILDYTGDMSDPQLARIIHHLHKAIVSPEMRHKMEEEDAIHNYIGGLEEQIDEERHAKEEAKAEAYRERKAKKEAIAQAVEERKAKKEADAKAAQADAKAAKAVKAEELERQAKEAAQVKAAQAEAKAAQADAENALLKKQLEAFMKKEKKQDDIN